MTNEQRLEEIKKNYGKLGWMPREDILWLIEMLENMYKNQ
ncbi:hypothetical protein COO91_08345 [Nostoc flagelliforme CCNUN1]|uniref:Uncharacterized protein n=1 Tax=Nostoc flagelliforme CCNUN1 TaxID=2038116 RepID=A0A2K8T3R7_9NOSO|nr:hypothetical protein COO91_08345 [Nostoc flagelliforme CCNUN1]